MTNYYNYPSHRFFNNTCIICFEEHKYSWTTLTQNQKNYLLNSNYLDGANRIDIKTETGNVYSLTVEEFYLWVKYGKLPKQTYSENHSTNNVGKSDITDESSICPVCGNQLVLRTAKRGINAGKSFWGCKSFPKCNYIRNI